jgi:hypothetical protein
MSEIIDIVRARIGRRHKITRQEMASILDDLAAAGLHLGNDCVPTTWLYDADGIATGPSPDASRAWAEACRGITCISVMPADGGGATWHGHVRYDQPGSLHPMHQAEVMFVSSEQEGRRYDPIGYLRGHAKRVLIVDADSELPPLPPSPQELREEEMRAERQSALVRHLRNSLDLDPPWSSILDDGTLQMIDCNDGSQARHQYRIHGDWIQRRRLPAAEVGDCWSGDDSPPEWEDMTSPPDGTLIWDYYEAIVA